MSTRISEDKPEVKEEKSQRQTMLEELRKTRTPPGIPSRNLDYPKREGYARRIVVDRPGRLNKFIHGGWSYVNEDQLEEPNPGTLKAGTREGLDSRVSQVVGTHKNNDPMTGYLMEIPIELYDEDQVAKMDHIDALESGMRQGMTPDGSDKPGYDGRYVPEHTPIKIKAGGRRR